MATLYKTCLWMIYTFVEMDLVSPIFTDLQATVHDCVKRWLLIATKYAMKYSTDFFRPENMLKLLTKLIHIHIYFCKVFTKLLNKIKTFALKT